MSIEAKIETVREAKNEIAKLKESADDLKNRINKLDYYKECWNGNDSKTFDSQYYPDSIDEAK